MASPEETTPTPANESNEQQVKLCLPISLLKKVDAAVKAQPIKTSRLPLAHRGDRRKAGKGK
jgi:hypothetical protein